MTTKLKDLDKRIKKTLSKIVKVLQGEVLNEVATKITIDIQNTQASGRMPDTQPGEVATGATRLKRTPALTKKTKRVYRQKGYGQKPLFNATGELKRSIGPKKFGNKVTIQSNTASGRKKLKWLANSKKRNGQQKKRRIALGWTKGRTKIIKDIIRNAIKRNFN